MSERHPMIYNEFDIEAARKAGHEDERNRIIKLLEQDICPDWTITCCDGACSAYKDAVALIKGNQK